ncbi:P-loop containing nucleoside triphosphate hydrolase protein [Martensiomyces pterosporus]|nr:P-loop containing nucleoside triphosphate hydrolase protein [Martensiomyces pterosporus]
MSETPYRSTRRVVYDTDSDSGSESGAGSLHSLESAQSIRVIDTTEPNASQRETTGCVPADPQNGSEEPEDISTLMDEMDVLEIGNGTPDTPSKPSQEGVGVVDSLKTQFSKYSEGQAVPLGALKHIPSHVRGYVSQELALNSSHKKSTAPLRQAPGSSKIGMLTRPPAAHAPKASNGSNASSEPAVTTARAVAAPDPKESAHKMATPIGIPTTSNAEYTQSYRNRVNERYTMPEQQTLTPKIPPSTPQRKRSGFAKNGTRSSEAVPEPSKEEIISMIEKLQTLSVSKEDRIDTPEGMTVQLHEHQKIGVAWMVANECNSKIRGGILADDMGMGKTIQALSLMMARPPKQGGTHGTLIVAPVSVLNHWRQEAESKVTPGRLKVLIHHGPKRASNPEILKQYDIVVTSYGTLSSDWKNLNALRFGRMSATERDERDLEFLSSKECGCIYNIVWRRIILDEAHQIKAQSSKVSRACHDLVGRYRWCLTGTPIQNSFEDIYPQLRFLRFKPYWQHEEFTALIQASDAGDAHLRAVFATIMLRRSKTSTLDNKAILTLPTRQLHIHGITLSHAEQFFYDTMAAITMIEGKEDDENTVPNVLSMLIRMRQATSHPLVASTIPNWQAKLLKMHQKYAQLGCPKELVWLRVNRIARKMDPAVLETTRSTFANIDTSLPVCAWCSTTMEVPRSSRIHTCGSLMCSHCWIKHSTSAAANMDCPSCGKVFAKSTSIISEDMIHSLERGSLMERSVFENIYEAGRGDDNDENQDKDKNRPMRADGGYFDEYDDQAPLEVVRQQVDWVDSTFGNDKPSSKLRKILSILHKMRQNNPTDKCVIFSEHLELIKMLVGYLESNGFSSVTLTGDMAVKKRQEAIETFSTDAACHVFVISKKAGATGLNLIAANHVILESLWWNPAIDNQAVDRVYRIGQTKDVHIHILVAKDTVDEKMFLVQEKKRQLTNSVIGDGSDGSSTKLTREDLLNIMRSL